MLLVDDPAVERLSQLGRRRQSEYLEDMADLAQAVERVCTASDPEFRRVNIEILGNTDPYLHTHVWPRYGWEPAERVAEPVWRYPAERWRDPVTALGPQHDDLRAAIAAELVAR